MKRIFFLLALSCMIMSFAKSDGTNFTEANLTELSKKSWNEDKPIFVFVGAPFCMISLKMDRLLQKKQIGSYMNDHYLCKKMDASKTVNNLKLGNMGITKVPTFLFMNSNRQVIYKANGLMDEDKFLEEAQKALKMIEEDAEIK